MGYTNPRISNMNVLEATPVDQYVIEATIDTASATPAGSTYAGIFTPNAMLTILAGTAAGQYVNTGTTAVPAWSAITHA